MCQKHLDENKVIKLDTNHHHHTAIVRLFYTNLTFGAHRLPKTAE